MWGFLIDFIKFETDSECMLIFYADLRKISRLMILKHTVNTRKNCYVNLLGWFEVMLLLPYYCESRINQFWIQSNKVPMSLMVIIRSGGNIYFVAIPVYASYEVIVIDGGMVELAVRSRKSFLLLCGSLCFSWYCGLMPS